MNALVGPGLVTCRRCGAPLVPDSRWSRGVWACSACGAVRFETPLAQPGSTEIVRQTTADVGGYRAAARPAEVLLVRHWRRPVHALMVALPLLVFGGPIVAAFLGHPELLGLFVQFWYAVFGLALVGYVGLCGLVNATRIELRGGELRVTHGPLPWRKDKRLPAAEVEDVWTQHVRVAEAPDIYRLRVALRGGGEIVILDELPSPEDGVFLEEAIATRLVTRDR